MCKYDVRSVKYPTLLTVTWDKYSAQEVSKYARDSEGYRWTFKRLEGIRRGFTLHCEEYLGRVLSRALSPWFIEEPLQKVAQHVADSWECNDWPAVTVDVGSSDVELWAAVDTTGSPEGRIVYRATITYNDIIVKLHNQGIKRAVDAYWT